VNRFLAVLLVLFSVTSAPLLATDTIAFGEFYKQSVLGIKLTPKLVGLAGKQVTVVGFMAPPLRATGNFFVLTRQPVSLCPFCNSDADWPADILVVYLKEDQTFIQRNRPLAVTGRLEVGSYTDQGTGFVSQVRLVGSHYEDQ